MSGARVGIDYNGFVAVRWQTDPNDDRQACSAVDAMVGLAKIVYHGTYRIAVSMWERKSRAKILDGESCVEASDRRDWLGPREPLHETQMVGFVGPSKGYLPELTIEQIRGMEESLGSSNETMNHRVTGSDSHKTRLVFQCGSCDAKNPCGVTKCWGCQNVPTIKATFHHQHQSCMSEYVTYYQPGYCGAAEAVVAWKNGGCDCPGH